MKFAFAYLGVPSEIVDAVIKEAKFITGNNTVPYFVKHGQHALGYRPHEATAVIDSFLPLIKQEGEKETGDVGLAAIYIRRGNSDRVITDRLFPFVLTVPIDWDFDMTDKKSVNQSKNDLVRRLNELGPIVRHALEEISRHLTEQRQRTPWLLPVRNFRSKYLRPALFYLQEACMTQAQTADLIAQLGDEFRQRHPMQKTQEGMGHERRYFVDDSGLQFRPPGRDLHGFHKPSEGHNSICELSSRRRLGAPYHRAFHYDCSKGNGATQANLHSCHSDNLATVYSEKHINIASNDYTRPEAKNETAGN